MVKVLTEAPISKYRLLVGDNKTMLLGLLDKCTRKCIGLGLNTRKNQYCMLLCRKEAYEKSLSMLEAKKNTVPESKKIESKILKLKQLISKLDSDIKESNARLKKEGKKAMNTGKGNKVMFVKESLSKESKIRILENFYALDLALLGKSNDKVEVCCPILKEEYVRAKGALISCLVEMYKRLGVTPKVITESVSNNKLLEMAKKTAVDARKSMKSTIITENSRKRIKTAIQESLTKSKTSKKSKKVNVDTLIESEVRKVGFTKMIDDMLVKRAVTESNNPAALKDWEGKVLIDAYRTLRENFIATAINLLES